MGIKLILKSVMGISFLLGAALPASAEPTYKADVPDNILTADKVESKYLGTLNYSDAFPSAQTVEKTYDFLDTSRAVQLFLSAMPASSVYGLLEGHKKIGIEANKSVGITEDLMNARSLWLTPQTTTPYVHGEIDVKNEPVVVELGSPVLGIINDAFFRYVADLGLGGPDRGKGGKYLIVGPDYKVDIPDGYIVLRTKTYRHWLLMRLVVQDGDLKKIRSEF